MVDGTKEIEKPEEKIPTGENGEQNPPEEIDIVIEGEEPKPEEDSSTIKKLRTVIRDQGRENKELRKNREAKEELAELGKKPTLEDFDHDTAKFEAAYDSWHSRKNAHEEKKAKKIQAEKDSDQAWENQLSRHREKASAMKVNDYEETSAVVESTLTPLQLGIIVNGSENSAHVMYFLGKNPKFLEDISKIKDVAKLGTAIGRMESKLKVKPKSANVKPEPIPTGSGKPLGSSDVQLEKLRAEAVKTGDYKKVHLYRKQLRGK